MAMVTTGISGRGPLALALASSLVLLVGCGGKATPLPPPTLTAFSPAQGVAGNGSTTVVTVTGSGLLDTTAVTIGGVTVPNGAVSNDTQIAFYVPSAAVTGAIAITTPEGTVLSSGTFKVVPQVTGIVPNSGPVGTAVTITGSGFVGTSRLTVGAESAAGPGSTFFVTSANQINGTIGADAVTGEVVVTASGLGSTSGPTFTVTH